MDSINNTQPVLPSFQSASFNVLTNRFEQNISITRTFCDYDLDAESISRENYLLDSLYEDGIKKGLSCHFIFSDNGSSNNRFFPVDSTEIDEPLSDSLAFDMPSCGGSLLSGHWDLQVLEQQPGVLYFGDVSGICSFSVIGATNAFLYTIFHNLIVDLGENRYLFIGECSTGSLGPTCLGGQIDDVSVPLEIGYFCSDNEPHRIWNCYYSIIGIPQL